MDSEKEDEYVERSCSRDQIGICRFIDLQVEHIASSIPLTCAGWFILLPICGAHLGRQSIGVKKATLPGPDYDFDDKAKCYRNFAKSHFAIPNSAVACLWQNVNNLLSILPPQQNNLVAVVRIQYRGNVFLIGLNHDGSRRQ